MARLPGPGHTFKTFLKLFSLRVRCHIVHLSAADALPIIRECKKVSKNLTVETCYHYLTLEANIIPNGKTEFKCCPPIRSKENQVCFKYPSNTYSKIQASLFCRIYFGKL